MALLIAGAAYVLWDSGDAAIPGEVERDASRKIHRAVRFSVVPNVRPELSWMYERGIAPRRIAGLVTSNGRPAADVEVSLRSEAMMHSKLAPPTRRSDSEGRFDFGEWPVTQYAVVAGGGEFELAVAKVDLVDPLVETEEVLVKLEACTREGFGTVTSLYGEEIAGATLSVVTMMRPANRFIVASQPIEADGSFRLCLSRRRTDLVIDAPGFAQASIFEFPGYPMPKEGWQVQLLPAGAIRGEYVDSQGRGIAGGRIALFRDGLSHHVSKMQHVISEADGAFAFTAVGPGKYEVAVDHFDYMLAREWPTVSMAPGEEKSGIIVTGGDCRKIAGTVITENGSLVVGADVWGMAKSQADGSFVINCALLEAFELDMATYRVLNPRIPAGTEDIDDLVVRVATPNALSGRVVGGGQPVANAAITLRSQDDEVRPFVSQAPLRTRSDDTGQYRFASVVPGTYALEASTATGASEKVLFEMADSDVERDLVIEAGTQVGGTVSTEDGVPLSGVAVHFVSASGKESSVTTETEDGSFQIMVSGSESHDVSVRRQYSGHYKAPEGAPWPTIAARAGDVKLTLRIAGAAQKLSGQVVYEDDSPVAHARVTVSPTGRDQQADEHGYFEFENLPASRFEVYAKDLMGLRATAKDIVAANGIAKGVKVVIERGATITGEITGGTPACKIELQGEDRRFAQGIRFSFDDLPPGDYTIEAQCGQAVAARSTTLAPGGSADLTLTLETGSSIAGIVKRFPTGEPIANLDCSAGMAEATTDSAGRFQLQHVPSLVAEIDCMRFQPPMALANGSISAAKRGHQEIEVWGFESPVGPEMLMKGKGSLGATLEVEKNQVIFTEIEPAGACAQLGILSGDVLTRVAGIAVHGSERVAALYLQTLPASASVEIEIRRGDAQMTFDLGP